jgi:hypothetical protein
MGVLNFKNITFGVKLTITEPYTEFEFLTGFESKQEDNTDTLSTSTRTLQVGDNSTGAELTMDNAELPRNKKHARLQHRIVTQGKGGFYEAYFEGEATTDEGTDPIKIKWLMRNGTFIANDSWSPTDMVTRSATLKASELVKEVDGYDGSGEYEDAENG